MTTPFDWSCLITHVMDETPPDVTFKIMDGDNISEVEAHKMVLGMVSPVFRKMFFTTDTMDRSANRIEVKETTKSAFQIMVDAIYNRATIDASIEDKSVDEVFGVVNIVKRYEISELVKAVAQYLPTFPVTDANVLEVASEAMEYSALFKDESREILLICAKYLKPKLKDVKSIFGYIAKNEDQKEVIATLLVLMNEITPTALTECPNCKNEPCQDGVGVKENEFREGLIVTNTNSEYWGNNYSWGKGKVTKIHAAMVHVVTINCEKGVNGSQFGGHDYFKIFRTSPTFVFFCN